MTKIQVSNTALEGDGRKRLLLVAMRLFAQSGFDGVSVRKIASDANVSAGLIKYHFESKEGLRVAVDAYFLEQSKSAIENFLNASAATPEFNLELYEQRWIQRYADEWPEFVAYLRRAIMEDGPWGKSLFKRYYLSLRGAIDRWDVEGRLSPEVDRIWVPLLYAFLALGPIVLDKHIEAILGKSSFSPEMWVRFQKALYSMLWHGIGNRTP
jgi:AcrR family transcriptional regulator